MPQDNKKLQRAKDTKNDEFYTRLFDIEQELEHYWPQLENKKIYLPCDDRWSKFFTYFVSQKFDHHIEIKYSSDDFRKNDELWEWADVIITNPPFSLVRKFFDRIMKFNKKFLIIAPTTMTNYKNVFPLIKENKVRVGYHYVRNFVNHKSGISHAPGIWLTNLEVDKPFIKLKPWDDQKYVKYDDYDAYETVWFYGKKTLGKAEFPKTDKLLGVPVSFIGKFNPKQFEIIDTFTPKINGKTLFQRFIVRLKDANL